MHRSNIQIRLLSSAATKGLMRLSEMREVLAQRGIQLTKSLGQNFLYDGNQLRRIVEAAELTRADKVLEIGPGLGPLTELLVAQAGEVLAIEKDARLVGWLTERFAPLQFVHDDALQFLKREPRDWSDWKLVANLPYSVASPILVELALSPRRPERMVATLQMEVAQRIMATVGDEHYAVLTLLIQLDYEPRRLFKIPASCFFPAPDVDSACVVLVRRPQPLLADKQRAAFTQIVKRAFSQRRKMMKKLLRQDWPFGRLDALFNASGLDAAIRAEAVSLSQFAQLARALGTPEGDG